MSEDIEIRDGVMRLSPRLAMQIAAWVLSLAMIYAVLDKRITTLETKNEQIAEDVREMKADVKLLLQRTAKP